MSRLPVRKICRVRWPVLEHGRTAGECCSAALLSPAIFHTDAGNVNDCRAIRRIRTARAASRWDVRGGPLRHRPDRVLKVPCRTTTHLPGGRYHHASAEWRSAWDAPRVAGGAVVLAGDPVSVGVQVVRVGGILAEGGLGGCLAREVDAVEVAGPAPCAAPACAACARARGGRGTRCRLTARRGWARLGHAAGRRCAGLRPT